MAGFAFQRRNERGCGKLFFRKQRDLVMTSLPRVLLVAILLAPVAEVAFRAVLPIQEASTIR